MLVSWPWTAHCCVAGTDAVWPAVIGVGAGCGVGSASCACAAMGKAAKPADNNPDHKLRGGNLDAFKNPANCLCMIGLTRNVIGRKMKKRRGRAPPGATG